MQKENQQISFCIVQAEFGAIYSIYTVMLADSEIAPQVKDIFNNAQFGTARHRKLIQSLRNLHLELSPERMVNVTFS